MTTFNQTIHAVSATSDFATLNRKVYLVRNIASPGLGTMPKQVGLIKSIASPVTTVLSTPIAIFKIFATVSAVSVLMSQVRSLSRLLKVYSVVNPIVVLIPNIVLLATSSVTRFFNRFITKPMSVSAGNTSTITKSAVTAMFVKTVVQPFFSRVINYPSLLPVATSEGTSTLIRSIPKTISASAGSSLALRKWLIKVLSTATASNSSSMIKSRIMGLTAVVVCLAFLVRINNISRRLTAVAVVVPTFFKKIIFELIKDSPIITAVVKSVGLHLSISSTVIKSLQKTFRLSFFVYSQTVPRLLSLKSLTHILYAVAGSSATNTLVSYVRQVYSRTLLVVSPGIAVLSTSNHIYQKLSQSLIVSSQVVPTLNKTLYQEIAAISLGVLNMLRKWC